MSRGLGAVERVVIAYLAAQQSRDWHSIRLDTIASLTGLHRESARRAIKSLARKGIVELGSDNGWLVYETSAGWEAMQFYETRSPTARLSADYLSTLSSGNGS